MAPDHGPAHTRARRADGRTVAIGPGITADTSPQRAGRRPYGESRSPDRGRVCRAAISAARGLKQVTEPYCREDGPWQVLARASTEALARASFAFTAKLGLAAVFWQAFFRTEMMDQGCLRRPHRRSCRSS